MTVKTFEIRVNNSSTSFAPGETIGGEVFVDLSEAKSCRGISLRFKGRAKVHWSESHGFGRTRRTTYYKAEENYFATEVYVVGSSRGEVELVAGRHIFPFTFTLPMNIPSSFKHKYGDVLYIIKAVIDVAWALDHKTYLPFTVYSPLDLSLTPSHTIEDEVHADFCWCILPCVGEGFMESQVHIPKSTYAIGDQLEVFVEITASSRSVDILGIELRLKQKLDFHAEGKTKSRSEFVEKSRKDGPFAENTRIVFGLQVPSVPHSGFEHCGIMDITYSVGVKFIVSGCHCNVKNDYTVTIGSKENVPVQDLSRPFAPPTAPTHFPTGGGFATRGMPSVPLVPVPGMMGDTMAVQPTFNPSSYMPVPPIDFAFPSPSAPVEPISTSVPPPSYESVMAHDNKK